MGPVNIADPIRKSNITSQFLSIEDPVDSLHPQSGARLLISWAGAEHTHHIVHHTLLKCVKDKIRAMRERESISHGKILPGKYIIFTYDVEKYDCV